jgi:PBSX family phage terminase large subunit
LDSLRFPLSEKYRDFLRHEAPVEFMEGSTASGKTTVGAVKFLLKAHASPRRQHLIAGVDLGTIERNVINRDMGVLDVFGDALAYHPSGHAGTTLPHLTLGDNTVYLFGYADRARWKKALGGQYGCAYIDEINVADTAFLHEVFMRSDYVLASLNPDSPGLPVYGEYINHSRPVPKYADDAPAELLRMLDRPAKPGWTWWYFSFRHNAALSDEKRERIIANTPVGTKEHKNKVLGLRGRATGLVFPNFDRARHVVRAAWVREEVRQKRIVWRQFSCGVDTAYSSRSKDTIALTYWGVATDGRALLLDERVYDNAGLAVPLAPSDTVVNIVAFMERNAKAWGFTRHVWVDSADQATLTEARKYNRTHPPVCTFNPAWKRTPVIDRINLQLGWLHHGRMLVTDACPAYVAEMESYSWDERKDSTPEDGNDHCVNSGQYAWLPYRHLIGAAEPEEEDRRKGT